MNTNTPLLTIPVAVPSYIPRRRGRSAVNAFDSTMHIRMNSLDHAVLEKAAKIYGIRKATFMRWASLQMAVALLEHHNGERPVIDP